MTEIITAKETPPTLCQENPVLAERLNQMMQEPRIHQEDSLPRKDWENEAKEALQGAGITILILDIAGGGKLAKNKTLIPMIQAIVDAIKHFQKSALTLGRQIAGQKRYTGSDEILILIQGKLNEEEIKEEVKRLKGHLEENTQKKNSVYIGVCSAATDIPLNRVLRGANIALKKAKESAKSGEGKEDFRHQTVTIEASGQAFLNGNLLDSSQLENKALPLAEEVQSENAIEEIKEEVANKKELTILSPRKMKEINEKYGMDGGDRVLAEISEAAVRCLEKLTKKLEIKIYKVGALLVIAANEKIPRDILEKIAQEASNEASLDGILNVSLDHAYA